MKVEETMNEVKLAGGVDVRVTGNGASIEFLDED